MSEENVEIVRAWMGAWDRTNREGMDSALDSFDPEIEWDASRATELLPDLAGVYHGEKGVRTFWRRWLSAWRDLRFEFDLREAGDDVVVLIRDQHQWGRHSGVETEVPPYAWVFTFRGSKVVRARLYPDQSLALEAAGLSE